MSETSVTTRKNWFARHKALTGLGVIVALLFLAAALSPTEGTNSGTATPGDSNLGASKIDDEADKAADHKEAKKPKPAEPKYTPSQENAIESALSYLEYDAFSRDGLIGQLSSEYGEGFSRKDAVFAVNHVGPNVDWNQQAVKSAKSYLEYDSYSCQGIVDQLSSEYGEQFTLEQAQHAGRKVGLC